VSKFLGQLALIDQLQRLVIHPLNRMIGLHQKLPFITHCVNSNYTQLIY
jgi:hypothetical protein